MPHPSAIFNLYSDKINVSLDFRDMGKAKYVLNYASFDLFLYYQSFVMELHSYFMMVSYPFVVLGIFHLINCNNCIIYFVYNVTS